MECCYEHLLVRVGYFDSSLTEPCQILAQGFSGVLANGEKASGRDLDVFPIHFLKTGLPNRFNISSLLKNCFGKLIYKTVFKNKK
jgi:hypothetical protein